MEQGKTKKMNVRWDWLFAGCALVLLVAVLMPPSAPEQTASQTQPWKVTVTGNGGAETKTWAAPHPHQGVYLRTAREIVAAKLKKFGAKRRALVHKLAEHYKIDVPAEVERFFDALDAGDWEETHRLFASLRQEHDSPGSDLCKYWRAILEAYGAAEQVNLWPPQQLLDYGNGVLDSLKPGMVYVGGTDPGCFICTMLNETSEGEQHLTLTQNALADSSYLDYLTAIYGDSLKIPTEEESQNAFNQYLQDATQRAQHDEQFPDEPKQLLEGENVSITDGRTSVSGQVAVMSINNLLTQILLQKNPDLSFAMEESFPLPSSYAGAAPLGPIFELRSSDAMTADQAGQSVNYWQNGCGRDFIDGLAILRPRCQRARQLAGQ
jgi:hypothetical protein